VESVLQYAKHQKPLYEIGLQHPMRMRDSAANSKGRYDYGRTSDREPLGGGGGGGGGGDRRA